MFDNVKLPSKSVVVPVVVPPTIIFTLGKGCCDEPSKTTPLRVLCAKIPIGKISKKSKNFFCSVFIQIV